MGFDPGQFAQFRTMQREMPEDLWQPIWDTVNYPAGGAASLSFFTVPVGQAATLLRFGATAGLAASASRSKTRLDTNLENAGVLPTKAFKLYGVSVNYVPLRVDGTNPTFAAIDKMTLALAGYLELRILDKPYLQIPTRAVPEASGLSYGPSATSIGAGVIGSGNPRDIFWLAVPLVFEPYQTFTMSITYDGSPAVNQGTDVCVILWGLQRRPSQ